MQYIIVLIKEEDTGKTLRKIPSTWTINYKDLTFNIKQMGFKHTGIFPEQAVNWEYMMNKIKMLKDILKS